MRWKCFRASNISNRSRPRAIFSKASAEMQNSLRRKKAAKNQDFEKAASLRDLVRDLKDTWKKTEKFTRIPYSLPGNLQPQNDLVELADVLDCPRHRCGLKLDISNISGTFAVSIKTREFQKRTARPRRLSALQNQNRRRPGRFRTSMAEVVRRRYTRLLSEGKIGATQKTKNDDDGHAVPDELQKVVDETSRKVRRQIPVKIQKCKFQIFRTRF